MLAVVVFILLFVRGTFGWEWPSIMEPGSSPVDWCEGNYLVSPSIAEFGNTLSNVLFFIVPPILIWLFRPYGQIFNRSVHFIWVLLIVVGICSAYFHATLSLLGQLLDELAILWLLAAAFALWYPPQLLPHYFKQNRSAFQWFILVTAILSTLLAFANPIVNAFALMLLSFPSFTALLSELRGCSNSKVLRLGTRCGILLMLAVVCWVNDKIFCEVWSGLNFPYLHAFWHILIFIAAYTACVLFAFFDAHHKIPEKRPELKYWPSDRLELFGIPYVQMANLPWEMKDVEYKPHYN